MKQKYSVLIVAGIVLVLYSVIVFLVPFHRGAIFWLSYVFTLIALAAQLLFLHVSFGGSTNARSRFYGYPIFRVGVIYLTAQAIAGLVFMILGTWKIPFWIPTVIYLIILALGAIGLIATDNVRDSVRLVEAKHADNTALIRNLRRSADIVSSQYPEFKSVAESLHYADPVSTAASESYERMLGNMIGQAKDCEDSAARQALARQMEEVLQQRNAVCKSGKTR